jgi:hypothetical protein
VRADQRRRHRGRRLKQAGPTIADR